MKFYLLAGSLLITAASVYGVTDYIKTKKAFENLYKEAPMVQKEEIKISDLKEEDFSRGKLESVPQPKEKMKPAAAAKHGKVKSKKMIEPGDEKPQPELIPGLAKLREESFDPDAVFTTAPKERKTIKKKVNLKMYSRAAPVKYREQVALTDTSYSNKN